MTATSRGRTGGQQKARDVRGLGMPIVRGPTASDRERRSAAAAARGVRVLESEPRLLEVALVVQRDAVQILSAEAVHEARSEERRVGKRWRWRRERCGR